MRKEFGKVIAELVKKDKKVHLLSLDVGYKYTLFKDLVNENPDNYHNLGVTEQASIGVASGMALEGLKPYVFTITPFLLERPFEQIKLDIVSQKANVKLISFWDYPDAGVTHITEDVESLCNILKIKLIKPKNSMELRKALYKTYESNEPVFFYLTKEPEN